jgi:hypothetical protein
MSEILDMAIAEALEDTRTFRQALAPQSTGAVLKLGPGQTERPLSEPKVHIFNTYLFGLTVAAKSSPAVALKSNDVLRDMDDIHLRHGWHTKPNTRSYTYAILSFKNSLRKDAGTHALDILRRMQSIHASDRQAYLERYGVPYDESRPETNRKQIVTADAVAYTTAMATLGKNYLMGPKVKKLLQEVLESEHVTADPGIFSAAIQAFGTAAEKEKDPRRRREAAQNAEEILWQMVREFSPEEKKGSSAAAVFPYSKSYQYSILIAFNACLYAWSHARVIESAPKCEEILQKMLSSTIVKPNSVSFNSCLYGT